MALLIKKYKLHKICHFHDPPQMKSEKKLTIDISPYLCRQGKHRSDHNRVGSGNVIAYDVVCQILDRPMDVRQWPSGLIGKMEMKGKE